MNCTHASDQPNPGNTPMVEVGRVFAKLECVNPTGSIKDRIAQYIVDESERQGLLKPGMRIVEATSGNTGIALAAYGRQKGYHVTIVMPEDMTDERKELIRRLGAELILCSKEGSFAEAVEIRDALAVDPNVFNPDQFSNELNVQCHYETTGQEILDQVPVDRLPIAGFVAGVGTGGTLIGVAKALRERFPDVRIVAVEPEESPVMSGGEAGRHTIFGIGDGFVPPIARSAEGDLHPLIDDVSRVSSEEALEAAANLRLNYGLCVGISSGANYVAARAMSHMGTVVTLFADGYDKYRSYGLTQASDPGCPFADCCKARDARLTSDP